MANGKMIMQLTNRNGFNSSLQTLQKPFTPRKGLGVVLSFRENLKDARKMNNTRGYLI